MYVQFVTIPERVKTMLVLVLTIITLVMVSIKLPACMYNQPLVFYTSFKPSICLVVLVLIPCTWGIVVCVLFLFIP